MVKHPTGCLFVICLLAVTALCQDLDLLDALGDDPTKPPPKPKSPSDGKDSDIYDLLDFDVKPTAKPPTKAPFRPRPKPKPADNDLDLRDALNPKNDIPGGKDKGSKGTEISDNDLFDLVGNNDYKPDKGKGSRGGGDVPPRDDGNYDNTAETGTIAGIASAVAMALVGAVSSYISYQKKKLCFSVQQTLNSEYMKAENPESVIFQEPPVQETRLQPPNAEPPTRENTL